MKLILFLLRRSRLKVAVIIVTGIVSGISSTGLIVLINAALAGNQISLAKLIWAFAGLSLAVMGLSVLSQSMLIRMTQSAIFELRTRLSRQILGVPLRRLEEIGAHRQLTCLTEDLFAVNHAFGAIPGLCINATIVACCLIYLGWLSLLMLLIVIGFIFVVVLNYRFIVRIAMKPLTQARDEYGMLFKHFRAITEGVKEMKLHRKRREAFLEEELQSTAKSYQRHTVIGSTIFTVAENWGKLFLYLLIGLLIFVFPIFSEVNTQTVAQYTLVIFYMVGPLQMIILTIPALAQAGLALQKVEELGVSLSALSTEPCAVGEADDIPVLKSIELAGVVHSYNREREDSKFTLGPIDLTLRPGELLFLVGGNGSGKTTLIKLVCGLYHPEEGAISLNGQPVTDENREQYRQLFSVVFGDFFLFESLLGLAKPDLDERARDYLAQLHLDYKVQVKDGKLSTTSLSQGQRKRLALLCAYLEERPFYIFDEWASDQDPLFKKVFYTELLPELKRKGKAVLVVTHDEKYFDQADRVVKLDNGKISHGSGVAEQYTPEGNRSAEAVAALDAPEYSEPLPLRA